MSVNKNVPDDLEIKCIKCDEVVGWNFDNQAIYDIITGFCNKCGVSECWYILDHQVKRGNKFWLWASLS